MRLIHAVVVTISVIVLSSGAVLAQPAAPPAVPRVINISGVFTPADGQISAVEVVTLSIYADETGGQPLWQESQSINLDSAGRYALLLGATHADGVPLDLFASGDARWLSLTWAGTGEVEGTRTRLTSVPYALRAADADTLGGRPASAYVLSPTARGDSTTNTSISPAGVNPGTTNFVAKYANATDVAPSALYEAGGFVGLNTAVPKDIFHSAFSDGTGAYTGIAVQNLSNTATSYSGMLFYDHTGALGQFQGFNNNTKEYRVNNIAMGGSINFLLGSASRLKVRSDGRIDVGGQATISSGLTGALGQAAGWTPPFATSFGGIFIEGSGDSESGGLYLDGNGAALWSTGDVGDLLQIYDEDTFTTPHNAAVTIPRFAIAANGNIRIGTGTTGCVMDADNTPIAGVCSSDLRLKRDIRAFDGSMLERALQLRPVYYNWRVDVAPKQFAPISGEAYGLIAQDVEKIYPEMVTTDSEGYKAVDYGKLQYVLLEALKEEHAEVAALKARLATLEAAASSEVRQVAPAIWFAFAGLGAVGFAFYRRS